MNAVRHNYRFLLWRVSECVKAQYASDAEVQELHDKRDGFVRGCIHLLSKLEENELRSEVGAL